MLSRRNWLSAIKGGGGSLFLKSLVNFSTITQKAQAQNGILADYLVNSLGFTKEAAIAASNKVTRRSSPFQKNADSVVNYLESLGLKKFHIRNMVNGCPSLLFCKVDKTLEPKIRFLQELGLSRSDLIKMVGFSAFWRSGLDSRIKPRILFLRHLVGADEKVTAVLKKYFWVFGCTDTKMVDCNLELYRNYCFSHEKIVKLIINRPRLVLATRPEVIQDVFHRVENNLGIPRESGIFSYGVEVLFSFSQSNIDAKYGIFRSYGWSDSDILRMVRILPITLRMSAPKIRKVLDFFMKELGYSPDCLASHPVCLCLSFEKRVKPRTEVFKILNEKKLNKRKAVLFSVLTMLESKFVKDYILPNKVLLPDMYAAYINKVGRTASVKC